MKVWSYLLSCWWGLNIEWFCSVELLNNAANPTSIRFLKGLKSFLFLRVLVHFIFLFLAGHSMKCRKKIARHQGNGSHPMPASATVILESDCLSIMY
jgi:hypothetical protein